MHDAYSLTSVYAYMIIYDYVRYDYLLKRGTCCNVPGVDAESGIIEGTACRSIAAGESLGAETLWAWPVPG